MARERRLGIAIGLAGFLGLALLYLFVLPAFRAGRDPAAGIEATRPVRQGDAAQSKAGTGGSEGLRTTIEPAGERSADTAASEADPAPAGRPLQALADMLRRDALWHLIDLSDWRAVDMFARSMERALPEVLGAGPGDTAAFAARLGQARSVRMRQVLLVAVGALGSGTEVEVLAGYLSEPGLRASSAYALGRMGSDKALDVLRRELEREGADTRTREALYFGLAQAGPRSVPYLLDAAEAATREGAELDLDTLLGNVRSPAARPALEAIARTHGDLSVRIMAIRGGVSASRGASGVAQGDHPESLVWLEDLASAETEDPAIRAEALRGLAELDRARSADLVGAWLAPGAARPELLGAALDAAASAGIPAGQLERVAELAARSPDPSIQERALRALCSAAEPEADRKLAELLPTLAGAERANVLLALLGRNQEYRPLDRSVGSGLTPELLDSLAELTRDPELDPAQRDYALQVLSESGAHREGVEAQAWQRYRDAEGDEHGQRLALVGIAPLVGAGANDVLMQSYSQSEEFLERLELSGALAEIPGNLEDEGVAGFLSGEVLPSLRSGLLLNTGASLAYLGRERSPLNPLAVSVANVFGRFGDRSDLELLDSLGPAFLENNEHWPEKLRTSVHGTLSEAAARAADLIALRMDP